MSGNKFAPITVPTPNAIMTGLPDAAFKELLSDLKWALEKTRSYANSKGAYGNGAKAEELLQKYNFNKGE